MSPIEIAALAILLASAILLVILAIAWNVQDRRPLDPPMPEPAELERLTLPPPSEIYQGQHRDWGPTTRLRPPN